MKTLRKIFSILIPPDRWKVPVIVVVGILTGLAFFLFHISNADSYLSDKPETCINCHVMYSQYDSWQHSSHARVANCNDCHVPHNNFINKYLFKAQDGLRHSTIFTLRTEPQVIRIKEAGRDVVQGNCERCHGDFLAYHGTFESVWTNNYKSEDKRLCWDCHKETPHGKVNSLASAPNARVPKLSPIIPEWMEKMLKK